MYLLFVFIYPRDREFPSVESLPKCLQYLRADTTSCQFIPSDTAPNQESYVLTHTLAGSYSQELETGDQHRHYDILISRPNSCSKNKIEVDSPYLYFIEI